MNLTDFRARIPAINSWLLAGVFFSIPLTVAPAYWLTALMLALWLAEGKYYIKFEVLRKEPLVWIFLAYYFVFVLSLLWSDDVEWGRRMISRQNFFLLFPLYFSVARREHYQRYVIMFLASVALCEVLAFYNFFQINVWTWLPEGIRVDKNPEDTAPFVDRIMYAPALAMAGYLLMRKFLFDEISLARRLGTLFFLLTTVVNLLFSGGRAGLVGFLALAAVLVFERFSRRPLFAGPIALAFIVSVLVVGYHGNEHFRTRFDSAVDQVMNFEERENTSVGLRIVFVINAFRVFKDSPVLGVGIGDYPTEYEKVNAVYTPDWKTSWNPHNQLMYVLTGCGLLGGVLLALVLLWPILRRSRDDGLVSVRRAVPLLFIVIGLFESYLMRSNTSLMFAVFTAALWCGREGRKA
jgi:O-antigen ligase